VGRYDRPFVKFFGILLEHYEDLKMNPNFIRLGSKLINLDQVSQVALQVSDDRHRDCVRVFFSHSTEGFTSSADFADADACALRAFFEDPSFAKNLTPNTKEEHEFEEYRDRGGEMRYENWLSKWRNCNELNALNNPSDSTINRISQLETELGY
jgi:hypothetical protein